ncbi:MAG: DegQ family serine endoprotease [Blastochloris sp.]|nr:DegQ family serine endoprotease [Blastochloris sp.]
MALRSGFGKKAEIVVNQEPLQRSASPTHSFASVVKKAAPSVVNIKTTTTKQAPRRSNPFNDPLFRRFFGDQFPGLENEEESSPSPRRRNLGLGSGVIMSKDGYIVTNNHVINEADEILVDVPSLGDQEFKATVVGVDPRSDLAVLKIDAKDLPAIVIGDSDQVEVGDIVLAIGNPFGLGQTVTQGIVSALGRNLKISRNDAFEDFIQTDASINQGNSGGALVDVEGRLLGINTAIIGPNGGNIGIGFAVPVNMARSVMEQLIEKGRVSRGYLGVIIQPVDADLAKSFGLPNNKGALVSQVSDDGTAIKAGIKRGDVIVELNGQPVDSPDELRSRIARETPGQKVKLKVFREGKPKNFEIALAELPESPKVSERGDAEKEEEEPAKSGELFGGLSVEELTPALRKRANIPDDVQGVLITSVDPTGTAAEAEIQPGAVLVEIGAKEVRNVKEATDVARSAKGKVRLLLWERGFFRYKMVQK